MFETDRATVQRTVTGSLANNTYLLSCKSTDESITIDASDLTVGTGQVLITHGHHDHISAAEDLVSQGRVLYLGANDGPMLEVRHQPISDGDVFEVGDLQIKAVATPGHTPGSTCFSIEGEPILFTGDTLFPGGPGATRWHYSDFGTIMASIRRLCDLHEPETAVFPGHGNPTTIGEESPHLDDWERRGW